MHLYNVDILSTDVPIKIICKYLVYGLLLCLFISAEICYREAFLGEGMQLSQCARGFGILQNYFKIDKMSTDVPIGVNAIKQDMHKQNKRTIKKLNILFVNL